MWDKVSRLPSTKDLSCPRQLLVAGATLIFYDTLIMLPAEVSAINVLILSTYTTHYDNKLEDYWYERCAYTGQFWLKKQQEQVPIQVNGHIYLHDYEAI